MSKKEITAIALRCFSLYIVVQVIISLPILVGLCLKMGRYGQHDSSALFIASIVLLSVVVGLAMAIFLWKNTNVLITEEGSRESSRDDISAERLMEFTFICMGLFFMIGAVLAFPRVFVEFQIAKGDGDQSLRSAIDLLSVILQIVFGGCLIAKPSSWIRLLFSVRRK